MKTELYHGQPTSIVVTFPSDPLAPFGYSSADITDVSMNFKADTATDADNQWLEKTLGAGVTHDVPTNTFTMTIDPVDYATLPVGYYTLVLAVNVAAVPGPMIELQIADSMVIITPDQQRD